MLNAPRADLSPNTFAYETQPLVKATGFREYDARWLFGSEINLLGVEALGLGLGTYIQELGHSRIVVGHDFRAYSLSIKQEMCIRDRAPDKECGRHPLRGGRKPPPRQPP